MNEKNEVPKMNTYKLITVIQVNWCFCIYIFMYQSMIENKRQLQHFTDTVTN